MIYLFLLRTKRVVYPFRKANLASRLEGPKMLVISGVNEYL
jgi:hypothetical protein